jgi:hypothetical protein
MKELISKEGQDLKAGHSLIEIKKNNENIVKTVQKILEITHIENQTLYLKYNEILSKLRTISLIQLEEFFEKSVLEVEVSI